MLIVYILAAGPGVAGEVTALELVVIAAAVGVSARAALPDHDLIALALVEDPVVSATPRTTPCGDGDLEKMEHQMRL